MRCAGSTNQQDMYFLNLWGKPMYRDFSKHHLHSKFKNFHLVTSNHCIINHLYTKVGCITITNMA
jgi:hypothetical protein